MLKVEFLTNFLIVKTSNQEYGSFCVVKDGKKCTVSSRIFNHGLQSSDVSSYMHTFWEFSPHAPAGQCNIRGGIEKKFQIARKNLV